MAALRAGTVIGLGCALVAAGAAFALTVLYPAGIALVVVPIAAAIWVRLAAAGISVQRFAPAGPYVEGEEYPLELELVPGPLPPPGGELRDAALERPLRFGPRGGSVRASFSFGRRGRHALGALRIVVRDPFGLTARSVPGPAAGEALVLPRTEPLRFGGRGAGGRALGRGRRGSGGSGPDSWSAEFEIDGLRPYREGSPAARIHWPTVARTGELHERRITAGADAARLVVVDSEQPLSEEALDAAVRAAASICMELAAGAGCALLIGGEARPLEAEPRLHNWPAVHARLALVEAGSGPPALQRIGRAGVVFWVTADAGRRPEQRLRRMPASRRLLVAPGPPASGAESLFTVAGCSAREVGSGARAVRAEAGG